MKEYLQGVPEFQARGRVAANYAEIRPVVGLPIVNLVYRNLATMPGRPEGVKAELAPVLREPTAHAIAGQIASSAKAGESSWRGGDPGGVAGCLRRRCGDARRRRAATRCLRSRQRDESDRSRRSTGWSRATGRASEGTPTGVCLRTPASPSGDGGAAATVARITDTRGADERCGHWAKATDTRSERLSPSHPTSCSPGARLDSAATALEHAGVRGAGPGAKCRCRVVIRELPFGVARMRDDNTRTVLGRFTEVIPWMLVLGAMVRAALSEGVAGRER